ncbi:hypothetical protein GCM10007874_19180 [Labrys miyagiensis]|uniref:Uncharacterized protein n=1 Tax=Labrys miyagiensis TaxID=346912 RepID=A0ABQ6CF56_9HYPH|nr:hypothetical protein GCM10007874_19180 [Labrys miyagiensis]
MGHEEVSRAKPVFSHPVAQLPVEAKNFPFPSAQNKRISRAFSPPHRVRLEGLDNSKVDIERLHRNLGPRSLRSQDIVLAKMFTVGDMMGGNVQAIVPQGLRP